ASGDGEERTELAIARAVARQGVSRGGELPDVGALPEARAPLQVEATVQPQRQLRKTALIALAFGRVGVPEHARVGGAAPLAPGIEVDPLRAAERHVLEAVAQPQEQRIALPIEGELFEGRQVEPRGRYELGR